MNMWRTVYVCQNGSYDRPEKQLLNSLKTAGDLL
jgi:hypothetical protein